MDSVEPKLEPEALPPTRGSSESLELKPCSDGIDATSTTTTPTSSHNANALELAPGELSILATPTATTSNVQIPGPAPEKTMITMPSSSSEHQQASLPLAKPSDDLSAATNPAASSLSQDLSGKRDEDLKHSTPAESTDSKDTKDSKESKPASGHVQFSHTPFIQKLYAMLEDPNLEHVITWGAKNDSFLVNPSNEFSQLLCLYFKHTNISSFVRQLSMYGFHKVAHSHNSNQPPNPKSLAYPWEFRHCDGAFRRGNIEALRTIKRRTSRHTSNSKRQRLSLANEHAGYPPLPRDGGQDANALLQHVTNTTPTPQTLAHPAMAPPGQPVQPPGQPMHLAQAQPQPNDSLFARFTYSHPPSVSQPSGIVGYASMIGNPQPSMPSSMPSSISSLSTNSLRSIKSQYSSVSSVGSQSISSGASQTHQPPIVPHPSPQPLPLYAPSLETGGMDNPLHYLMQTQQNLQQQILELNRAVSDIRSAMDHMYRMEPPKSAPKPAQYAPLPLTIVESGMEQANHELLTTNPRGPSPLTKDLVGPLGVRDEDVVLGDHSETVSPKHKRELVEPSAESESTAGPEAQDRLRLKSLLN